MKKIFAILSFCLLIFTVAACSNEPAAIDVSGVELESITVDYDGEAHSIECKNVPDGVKVTYFGNGVIKVGEHRVTAVLKDESGTELARLKATITIVGEEDPEEDEDPEEGEDPDDGEEDYVPDPEASGYVLEIGGEYYDLYADEEGSNEEFAQYFVDAYVYAEDLVVAYDLEGNVITAIGDERGETGNTNNVLGYGENMTIIVEGDVTIYFKVYVNGGYSLWVTGNDQEVPPVGGNQGGGNQGGQLGEDTEIYFVPGPWDVDGAWYAVYWFNSSEESGWVKVENGSAVIPANAEKIIFVRMNPASEDFSWDNKWNQTNDLTVDGTTYTVTGWEQSDGAWS